MKKSEALAKVRAAMDLTISLPKNATKADMEICIKQTYALLSELESKLCQS